MNVTVCVYEMKDLRSGDVTGKGDGYIIVRMNDKKHPEAKTRVVKDNRNPVWNESAIFKVENAQSDTVFFHVWDSNTISDQSLGTVTCSVAGLTQGENDIWLQVPQNGKLHVKLTPSGFGHAKAATAAPAAAPVAATPAAAAPKVVAAPAPVVVAAPTYAAQPVYAQPTVVHAPAPVVYAAPAKVYAAPQPVYVQPTVMTSVPMGPATPMFAATPTTTVYMTQPMGMGMMQPNMGMGMGMMQPNMGMGMQPNMGMGMGMQPNMGMGMGGMQPGMGGMGMGGMGMGGMQPGMGGPGYNNGPGYGPGM